MLHSRRILAPLRLRVCDRLYKKNVMKKVKELALGNAVLGVGSSGGALFGYPPRLRSGLRQNGAGFLEKREKGRTPISANLSGILFWAVNPSPGGNQQALTGIFEFPRSRLLASVKVRDQVSHPPAVTQAEAAIAIATALHR